MSMYQTTNPTMYFSNRLTHHADPDELLGVVEAGLQQFREVVVLGGADESGDGEAVERARPRVQVRQQHAERLAVELDHAELQAKKEGQWPFRPAPNESRNLSPVF